MPQVYKISSSLSINRRSRFRNEKINPNKDNVEMKIVKTDSGDSFCGSFDQQNVMNKGTLISKNGDSTFQGTFYNKSGNKKKGEWSFHNGIRYKGTFYENGNPKEGHLEHILTDSDDPSRKKSFRGVFKEENIFEFQEGTLFFGLDKFKGKFFNNYPSEGTLYSTTNNFKFIGEFQEVKINNKVKEDDLKKKIADKNFFAVIDNLSNIMCFKKGKLIFEDKEFEGTFYKNGNVKEGEIIFTNAANTSTENQELKYEGTFSKELNFHRQNGIVYFKNLDKFKGSFFPESNSIKKGILTKSNGEKLEGKWTSDGSFTAIKKY